MAERVVVVGQGYVGLPLAVLAAEAGFEVVGFDTDPLRAKRLAAGCSYVEDVRDTRLRSVLRSQRYRPSCEPDDIAGFDYCVLAVPTPLREGRPDLSAVEEAAETVARFVRPGCVMVLESTSYPGTTDEVLRPILERGSGLGTPGEFFLGFSPERIDPGNTAWTLENTPKVVAGLDDAALERVRGFYDRLVTRTVPVSSTRTAELSKLLENTFRQVNIALVNELAQVADGLGCDLREAIEAAATKPFGFMPFSPGPGVGGHCLPVDSAYLSWCVRKAHGRPLRIVELANEVNHGMPAYVVGRLAARIPLRGARVLLLGLSYKANTADLRESPALEVAELLLREHARVRACDPLVGGERMPAGIEPAPLTAEELALADAVAILTDHDCFDYDLIQRHATYLFDARDRCRASFVDRL